MPTSQLTSGNKLSIPVCKPKKIFQKRKFTDKSKLYLKLPLWTILNLPNKSQKKKKIKTEKEHCSKTEEKWIQFQLFKLPQAEDHIPILRGSVLKILHFYTLPEFWEISADLPYAFVYIEFINADIFR